MNQTATMTGLKDRSTEVIFMLMISVVPLSQLAIDIYTPSLPAMQAYFAVNESLIQLSISIYILCLGLGQFIWGALSDVVGRRPVLMMGTLLLLIGAIAAVFSQSIFVLLLSRIIQGFGAAATNSVSRAVITDMYAGKKLMAHIATVTTVWSLIPIIAPFAGGYLQTYFNWQASFVLLAIYTLLVLIALHFIMVETNTNRVKWDIKALLKNYCKVIFHKSFTGCLLNCVMFLSIIMIFNAAAPFIYQVGHGFTSHEYGIVALTMGAAFSLGAFISRFIVKRFTPVLILHISQAVIIICSLWMMIASHYQIPFAFAFTISLWIIFFVIGPVSTTALGHVLSIFKTMAGVASAAAGVLVYVGASLIVSIVSRFSLNSEFAMAVTLLSVAAIGVFGAMLIYKRSD